MTTHARDRHALYNEAMEIACAAQLTEEEGALLKSLAERLYTNLGENPR